jgi:lipopolysaccharide export system protein LptA
VLLWSVLAVAASLPQSLAAQGLGALEGGDRPLEINADEGIEWRRDDKVYVARGNARAARGNVSVTADVLTAHYRQGAQGATEIWRIEAEGDVRLRSERATAFGGSAIYDIDRGVLVLLGENLRLETGQDLITAEDSLEYWEKQRLAVARGEAQAIRDDQRVRAEVLAAHLLPGRQGDLELNRVDAYGNVRISTAQEYARGDRGVYYAKDELATLAGDVRITRGENQLNGEYAEVNLASGISRLMPAPPGSETDQRVRGLLVPGSQDETRRGL